MGFGIDFRGAFTLAEVFSPPCEGSRKIAFTLAEVLITLGIIGIVAAMTMPSLIANHQKKQAVVQLRKVYSDLSNAVKLSEVDNGPMDGWNYPFCNGYSYECIDPYLQQYWLPYFQGAKIVDKKVLNKQGYFIFKDEVVNDSDLSIITHYIILNNGTILAFFSNIQSGYIWLFADINGMKGPNRIGRDIFVFDVYNFVDENKFRLKFWGHHRTSSEALITNAEYACNKDNTSRYKNFYCGRLIELNGWKIPDNYPW